MFAGAIDAEARDRRMQRQAGEHLAIDTDRGDTQLDRADHEFLVVDGEPFVADPLQFGVEAFPVRKRIGRIGAKLDSSSNASLRAIGIRARNSFPVAVQCSGTGEPALRWVRSGQLHSTR